MSITPITQTELREELVVFLRNQDILSISERGVTTTTAEGTLSGTATITIARSNVKNIRSITIDAVSKAFGTDYSVNYDSSGNCVITFTSNQTGDYVVSYDYGSDKIYPDYPRTDLKLASYPRIALHDIQLNTTPGGFGDVFESNVLFSVTIFTHDDGDYDLITLIQNTRNAFLNNRSSFYNLKLITTVNQGPEIKSGDRNQVISQITLDITSQFQYEK